MGGDIITFWTGQCGIQLANACWELYALEHCITPDGKLLENSPENDNTFENFFSETSNGQFVPRSILIDLEPTVIDEIKMGLYRKLFNPETLINSFEDAANNFARGFYCCGREIIKSVVEMTRKMTENSNSIQAFMIHHSFGGGTGSGFTSMLHDYLSIEYAKRTKLEYGVFPSPSFSVSVVEPYNTILALHTPMENADLAVFFENESIFRICHNNMDVFEINFSIINRILAQVISGTTASLRFEGPINANIIDFQTNLVPYPRIHFPLLSFYPILSPSRINHQSLSTQMISEQAFHRENQMSDVYPMSGAYMSCCLLYRGHINIIDVNSTINHLKGTLSIPWVDWCPTGFKVGINYQPMVAIPSSGIGYSQQALSLLCNTTAFKSVLGTVNRKFINLYARKCFVHWYVAEGMEESEFKEALEDVLMLEKDYEMIESTSGREKSQTRSEKNNSSKDQSKISKSKLSTLGAYSDTKPSEISKDLTESKTSSMKNKTLCRNSMTSSLECEDCESTISEKKSFLKNLSKISKSTIYNLLLKTKRNEISKILILGALLDTKPSTKESSRKLTQPKSSRLESEESESTRSKIKNSSENLSKISKSMVYNLLFKTKLNEISKILKLGALLDTKHNNISKYLNQSKPSSMKTKESSRKLTRTKPSILEYEDSESTLSAKKNSSKNLSKISKSMIYNILFKTKINEISKILKLGALLDKKPSRISKDLTQAKQTSKKTKEMSQNLTESKPSGMKSEYLSRNSTSSSSESQESELTQSETKISSKNLSKISKFTIYNLLSKAKINQISKILTLGALLDKKPSTIPKSLTQKKISSMKSENLPSNSTSSSEESETSESTRSETKIASKNLSKISKSTIDNLLSKVKINQISKILTLRALLDKKPTTVSKSLTQKKTSSMKSKNLSKNSTSSSEESEASESTRSEEDNYSNNQSKTSKYVTFNTLSEAETNDISRLLTYETHSDTKPSTISKNLTQPQHSSTKTEKNISNLYEVKPISMKTKESLKRLTMSKIPSIKNETLTRNSKSSNLELEENESNTSNVKAKIKEKINNNNRMSNLEIDSERHSSTTKNNNICFEVDVIVEN